MTVVSNALLQYLAMKFITHFILGHSVEDALLVPVQQQRKSVRCNHVQVVGLRYRILGVATPFYYRLRNDLLCVGWGVKLYSLTHSTAPTLGRIITAPSKQGIF